MPVMVKTATERLRELKGFLVPVNVSRIMSVFTDPAQLGKKHIIAVSVRKRKLYSCKKNFFHINSVI